MKTFLFSKNIKISAVLLTATILKSGIALALEGPDDIDKQGGARPSRQVNLTKLPDELLEKIFSYLPKQKDCESLALTGPRFLKLLVDPTDYSSAYSLVLKIQKNEQLIQKGGVDQMWGDPLPFRHAHQRGRPKMYRETFKAAQENREQSKARLFALINGKSRVLEDLFESN